jgi:hypothetical protein
VLVLDVRGGPVSVVTVNFSPQQGQVFLGDYCHLERNLHSMVDH